MGNSIDIKGIIQEREARYGEFEDNAAVSQSIKGVLRQRHNPNLTYQHKEALDMIAAKMARIVNGDPNYKDNWVDISGYAQLVVEQIEKNEKEEELERERTLKICRDIQYEESIKKYVKSIKESGGIPKWK